MPIRKRTQSREFALQILYQISITKSSIEDTSKSFWQTHTIDPDIQGFADLLVQGSMNEVETIDEIVVKYAENWNPERMALIDRIILRMGVYEIMYCDDIPIKVTINEAVELAKRFSQGDSGKFVNGILDKVSHKEKLPKGKEQ